MNEHVLHSNLYTTALVLSWDGLVFGTQNILAKVQTRFSATRTPAFVKILLIVSKTPFTYGIHFEPRKPSFLFRSLLQRRLQLLQ